MKEDRDIITGGRRKIIEKTEEGGDPHRMKREIESAGGLHHHLHLIHRVHPLWGHRHQSSHQILKEGKLRKSD